MPKPDNQATGLLGNIFSEIFILGSQIQHARDLGNVDTLRTRIELMVHQADQRGVECGFSRDLLADARFAVVAYLDEMIFNSGWSKKQEWASRPLQYQFFETHVAGEEFFQRLQAIRKRLPVNGDLLEVFYICLVFGFEGQYKLQGREKVKDLIADLCREILGVRGEFRQMSNNAQRKDEVLEVVKRDVPVWVVGVFSIAIVCIFYVALFVLMQQETGSVTRSLEQLAVEVIP